MDGDLTNAGAAFEGAQGFGSDTTGGRGGEIVKVTTLADSGPGSLRWALEELDGPRIVVFDVSGQIQLNDSIEINGDVTIAGQTSPEGVTISGAKLRVVEDNVIIRGLQFRPGDGEGDKPSERDGISIGSSKQTVENVVIDSNSFSWSVDELITLWYGPKNVTISNNILAEALDDSIHPEGDHSMGLLIGDGSSNVTVVGNLFAHNEHRNAQVKDDAKNIEFINNLVYNHGPNGFESYSGTTAHVIGNVYIKGADSADRAPIRLNSPEDGTAYYVADNFAEVGGNAVSKISNGYVFDPSNVTIMPTSEVKDHVLSNAGARYPELNAVDQRIVKSVVDGTGRIIDSPDDVGGYVHVPNTKAPSDRDNDGIPDYFEERLGSNPDAFDAHGDADGNGVHDIEDYINGLLGGYAADSQPAPAPTPAPAPETLPATDNGTSDNSDSSVGDASGFRFEAEDFTLNNGFVTNTLAPASGGQVIRVKEGQSGEASTVFNGESGTYDLNVGYFDEADGASDLSVLVNGQVVHSWTWDQDLGSNYADKATATQITIENVKINAGDVITFSGTADAKEPLRIDYLDVVKQAADGGDDDASLTVPVVSPPSNPDQNTPSNPGNDAQKHYFVEAETFDIESGWKVKSNSIASGDAYLNAVGDGPAKASTAFEGETGYYDIVVNYYDESDGESDLSVNVGGETVDSWTWDQETSQKLATRDTLTGRVIEDVWIEKGELIAFEGTPDGNEPLRVDSIEFYSDLLA
ncbi:right-handed parallel beta-helix repeat-containing protein [Ruegeria halocynthiae]|uniref:right-handed parallel beta-helix repeat-containing protein n=1 Tax=Ruegeria halocynthiae TaxID=985054 RepID=UPI000568E7D2|nr:right-handed parallel beta-helix repeat-containing protein [Ruegeria halocynthiae]